MILNSSLRHGITTDTFVRSPKEVMEGSAVPLGREY
jgi:hypothetical protein